MRGREGSHPSFIASDSAFSHRGDDAAPDAAGSAGLWAFGLLCCAPALLLYGSVLTLPFPFEYAEGDTALWVHLWRAGFDVYARDELLLLRSNYPPLYLALVAALARGDDAILWVGRLLSLAGFAMALCGAGMVAARACGARGGLLCCLLLCALAQVGIWGVTCRPDGLGLGFGVLGLTALALRGRGAWGLAGACFAVALLCKHSLLVLPLGAGLWTLRRSPRQALGLVLSTAVPFFGALFAFAGFSYERMGALLDMLVLGSAAPLSGLTLVLNLLVLGPPLAPLLWLALREAPAGGAGAPGCNAAMLGPFRASLLVGLCWSAALARTGAAGNHLLELSVCAAVLAPCAAFAERPRRLRLPLGVAALASAILTAQLLVWDVPLRRAQARAAAAALAGVRGLVLCEQSFHALQHRQVIIPFLATQQARLSRWEPAPLVAAIADGRIERVVLGSPLDRPATFSGDRIPAPLRAALLRRYRLLEQRGGLWIYGP